MTDGGVYIISIPGVFTLSCFLTAPCSRGKHPRDSRNPGTPEDNPLGIKHQQENKNWSRFLPLPLCGACPFVGTVVFVSQSTTFAKKNMSKIIDRHKNFCQSAGSLLSPLTTESPTTHYCTVQHHVPIDPYTERMPRANHPVRVYSVTFIGRASATDERRLVGQATARK